MPANDVRPPRQTVVPRAETYPFISMPAKKRPTPYDRAEAVRLTLAGLATGREPDEIVRELAALHPRNRTTERALTPWRPLR
jgi:hypothetical protein